MATFKATIKGNRGGASRLGHKEITAEVNGWNVGIKVNGFKDLSGKVKFCIFETGGTNGAEPFKLIKVVEED